MKEVNELKQTSKAIEQSIAIMNSEGFEVPDTIKEKIIREIQEETSIPKRVRKDSYHAQL